MPTRRSVIKGAAAAGGGASIAALFALCFIPMQAILILSALWAAKSRWDDDDTGKRG